MSTLTNSTSINPTAPLESAPPTRKSARSKPVVSWKCLNEKSDKNESKVFAKQAISTGTAGSEVSSKQGTGSDKPTKRTSKKSENSFKSVSESEVWRLRLERESTQPRRSHLLPKGTQVSPFSNLYYPTPSARK